MDSFCNLQIPQTRVIVNVEKLSTHKRLPLAHTPCRAFSVVTRPLVIVLRTLGPAVTQMVRVQAHSGIQTAVVARTGHVIAALFVFSIRAVEDTVAPSVER